ncbi:hypothetical protein HYALB_00012575 [Hymenoscyphus albidus]|uniref:Uncharacterized protein n=1 Tax=Hymenoscyphus albidus TaxID=595503 RepID=A0A9N9LMS2_9HELO|nr:hypothetical protein HYALB_00012575 [Hymenoscyphus albidus]
MGIKSFIEVDRSEVGRLAGLARDTLKLGVGLPNTVDLNHKKSSSLAKQMSIWYVTTKNQRK